MTADGTYRPAHTGETITTAAELDALPVDTVLVDVDAETGYVNQVVLRLLSGDWAAPGLETMWNSADLVADGDERWTVLFRPDAPQPATTDDAVERALNVVSAAIGDWDTPEMDSAWGVLRAALAAAGAGAEPRATLLRLADEMQQAEWPGTGAETRAVVGAIADTLRDEAARSGAGPEADREPERRALAAIAEETEGHPGLALLHGLTTGAVGPLAARNDAATQTEVEWGVRNSGGTAIFSRDRMEAEFYAEETDGTLLQRTVSAWREVTP